MPVYNGQKYLATAVQSILDQSLHSLELIVIDDGSVDDTHQILSSISDPRLRLLQNETNLGVARSLNRALDQCRGRYVARMDADDVALPHRLERQVKFLESHPAISLVGSGVRCMGASGNRIQFWSTHAQIHAQCLFNSPFAHPTVCWKRDHFEKHSLRYQEEPPTAEDFELWERSIEVVKMANLNAPLLCYRIDPTIKISAYVKQQIAGARWIRQRLLNRAKIDLSPDLLELLQEVGEGSMVLSNATLCRSQQLFAELIRQNGNSRFFEPVALQEVLSRQFRQLLLRHVGVVGGNRLWQMANHALRDRYLIWKDLGKLMLQLAAARKKEVSDG